MRGPPGPPMTLANVRQNGVRAGTADLPSLRPLADVAVDALPETVHRGKLT